jgi:hypothetical protein
LTSSKETVAKTGGTQWECSGARISGKSTVERETESSSGHAKDVAVFVTGKFHNSRKSSARINGDWIEEQSPR